MGQRQKLNCNVFCARDIRGFHGEPWIWAGSLDLSHGGKKARPLYSFHWPGIVHGWPEGITVTLSEVVPSSEGQILERDSAVSYQ